MLPTRMRSYCPTIWINVRGGCMVAHERVTHEIAIFTVTTSSTCLSRARNEKVRSDRMRKWC